ERMAKIVGVRDNKSGSGDQSGAALHKAGYSPEGGKSGSTEMLIKKVSWKRGFVDRRSKNTPILGSNPSGIPKISLSEG
ncbi:MAG: hypothetical protein ABF381_03635, partial [Akkermansiaceae bacterium]